MGVTRVYGAKLLCTFSDRSRAWHCDIPAQFQRMPHRHEMCATLCPSENLNTAVLLLVTPKTMAALMFQGPPFLKVGLPFHNFRSITVHLYLQDYSFEWRGDVGRD